MLPEKKTIIIFSFVLIVCLSITLHVISDIFQPPQKTTPQMKNESHNEVYTTTRTNVTDVFVEQQNVAIGSLQNNKTELLDMNFVPIETARRHAEVQLARLMYTTSQGLAGTNFSGVALYPDPIITYNDDGTIPQYYKFYAGVRGFKNILVIIPARKDIGFLGLPPALGSSDDTANQMMLEKAQEYYNENFAGSDIVSVKFITSACRGENVQLKVIPERSGKITTVYLEYGTPRNQESCRQWENTTLQATPDRIAEWEAGDSYYRLVQSKAQAEGINLTEACIWDKRDRMKKIFELIQPPPISPR